MVTPTCKLYDTDTICAGTQRCAVMNQTAATHHKNGNHCIIEKSIDRTQHVSISEAAARHEALAARDMRSAHAFTNSKSITQFFYRAFLHQSTLNVCRDACLREFALRGAWHMFLRMASNKSVREKDWRSRKRGTQAT